MKTITLVRETAPQSSHHPYLTVNPHAARPFLGRLLLAVLVGGAAVAAHAQTTFTKITEGDIVNDLGHFVTAAWGDVNNDGFLDLVVAGYNQTNVFYLNNGTGTFRKVIQGDPVADADYHIGSAWGDYDNDGNPDLLVSAGKSAPSARRNQLFHNNGDGTFSRVSGGSVTNQLGFFGPCAWADYDNDGFLDFFVPNHGDSNDHGGKNLLFHNNGDGTFTKITSGAVVNDISVGWDVRWADYDNDGFQDLFVTAVGGAEENRLYHNNGDGTFTRITSGPMLSPPPGGESRGCAWGDFDNDGYLDLFVANGGGNNGLFHNNGDGTFDQILDGDPVIDGGPELFFGPPCSWVDYDNDGFLDLLVSMGSESAPLGNNVLYHNDGNSNAWLEVKCVGTVANRSAIGTKVRVKATSGGKTFWQMREINNTGPLVAHFGLGDATNVDTVRVEWPSGTVQEVHNVSSKQIWAVTEPPRLLAQSTGGVPLFSLKGGRGFQYQIEASTNLTAWSATGTLTITNLNGTAPIIDTSAPASNRRFYRAVSR